MRIDFQLEGAQELNASLLALGKDIATRIGRRVTRKAVDGARSAIQATARNMVGGKMGNLLANNLEVTSGRSRGYTVSAIVGISAKANPQMVNISYSGNRTYIPTAIEYGHVIVGRGQGFVGVRSQGAIRRFTHGRKRAAAIPFMRSGFERSKDFMIHTLTTELRSQIEAAWARRARKASAAS